MYDLERYINSAGAEPKVVRCALAHYQFETIHPFGDGNGRVGRLMIVLHLMGMKLLSAPLIYPSVYFERTREEYYARLQGVRERGEWEAWVRYFSKGVEEQCGETIALARTIRDLQEQLRRGVSHTRRRSSVEAVLGVFFEYPVLTVKEIGDGANISLGAARAALEDLEDMGWRGRSRESRRAASTPANRFSTSSSQTGERPPEHPTNPGPPCRQRRRNDKALRKAESPSRGTLPVRPRGPRFRHLPHHEPQAR